MAQALTTRRPPQQRHDDWPIRLPAQNRLQDSIHEGHHATRDKIIKSLAASSYKAHLTQGFRMAECGSRLDFYLDPRTGKVDHWLHRCKSRLCPLCADKRSRQIALDMIQVVNAMRRPRTIVLTVKSEARPLAIQLRDLRRHFSRLRRSKLWRKSVAGGVYVTEITINQTTGLWHPHLHIIYDGSYIPHTQLREAWHDVTKESQIVWIEDVHSRHNAVNELCKYVGKPPRTVTWTEQRITDYATAVAGSRMVQTFGNVRRHEVPDTDLNPKPSCEQFHVSMGRVMFLATTGSNTAAHVLAAAAALWPYIRAYVYQEMPQLAPEEWAETRRARALARITGGIGPAPPPQPTPPLRTELEHTLATALNRLYLEETHGHNAAYDRGQEDPWQ
jgi:hypothetical protein